MPNSIKIHWTIYAGCKNVADDRQTDHGTENLPQKAIPHLVVINGNEDNDYGAQRANVFYT